jgi:hypothetical protein
MKSERFAETLELSGLHGTEDDLAAPRRTPDGAHPAIHQASGHETRGVTEADQPREQSVDRLTTRAGRARIRTI